MPEMQNEAAPAQALDMPRPADRSWARMQPIQVVPSRDRLDAPWQTVTIKNTSPDQRHIVIDRSMVGHELEPGQSKKDVQMLVKEIEYFLRQRAPGRFDAFGRPFNPHPIEIIGFKAEDALPQPQAEKRKQTA